MQMAIQHVSSKWTKTRQMVKNRHLRPYIPVTKRMNKSTVRSMLQRYGMIYVKPVVGTFGNGVMRVEKRSSGPRPYSFQLGVRRRSFISFDAMYRALSGAKRSRRYLAQKGIRLLKHRGLRFDLRVMVQQSPRHRWETTGLIARVAHPGKIVTNYHSGGKPMSIDRVLDPIMARSGKAALVRKLRRMGVLAARQLHKRYGGLKEIGLDVGLDRKLKPWIIEANTCPDPFIFRKLKDKRVFRKVYRYAAAYGRFRRKP